jgi:cation-transporting ATPase E
MALGITGIYSCILAIPDLRNFFELALLSKFDYLFLVLVALEWGFILRWFWRTRIFDRFLGVNLSN